PSGDEKLPVARLSTPDQVIVIIRDGNQIVGNLGGDGLDGMEGQTATAGVDTWVTVAPQVKEFCSRGRYPDPTLRLEQLLGLPSDNGKKWFVELWVSPSDLFRPSPDPKITDQTAGLEFPAAVSQQHVEWIEGLKAQSYGENGYPWTRLGYTYDWGNTTNREGLSEFVIRKGAPIEVNSVTTTLDYCN
ncbi:MAG TPA: hypothetical protein VHS28_00070, partial [Chloroflexota bacterium]|nr:hypothetical protein [Chloroflexota bacterium]